jgi:short subunit dehydrogenase-like uncharacterized protein
MPLAQQRRTTVAALGERAMKVVVFGATGATGRLVVERALAAGHAGTAAARHPASVRE